MRSLQVPGAALELDAKSFAHWCCSCCLEVNSTPAYEQFGDV